MGEASTASRIESKTDSVKVDISCLEDTTKVVEDHEALMQRSQWVRAAILGANDGLLSTTSLMLGIGAAKEADRQSMVLSGLAGAVAGAFSMAVGEFVSVSTQKEIEYAAQLRRKNQQKQMQTFPSTCSDPKQSHISALCSPAVYSPARSPTLKVLAPTRRTEDCIRTKIDGISTLPNPIKAAAASWFAFICGSLVPLATTLVVGGGHLTKIVTLALVTSVASAVFGGLGARLGESSVKAAATRVLLGGWVAMGITYGVLKPFDKDHR